LWPVASIPRDLGEHLLSRQARVKVVARADRLEREVVIEHGVFVPPAGGVPGARLFHSLVVRDHLITDPPAPFFGRCAGRCGIRQHRLACAESPPCLTYVRTVFADAPQSADVGDAENQDVSPRQSVYEGVDGLREGCLELRDRRHRALGSGAGVVGADEYGDVVRVRGHRLLRLGVQVGHPRPAHGQVVYLWPLPAGLLDALGMAVQSVQAAGRPRRLRAIEDELARRDCSGDRIAEGCHRGREGRLVRTDAAGGTVGRASGRDEQRGREGASPPPATHTARAARVPRQLTRLRCAAYFVVTAAAAWVVWRERPTPRDDSSPAPATS
jgi:hypothetical protein